MRGRGANRGLQALQGGHDVRERRATVATPAAGGIEWWETAAAALHRAETLRAARRQAL